MLLTTHIQFIYKLELYLQVAGIIDIYGCPDEKRGSRIVCPFCQVFPQQKIMAWLDDIDSDGDTTPRK